MIRIICVGKTKEKYEVEYVEEYIKRLSRYVKIELVELKDEKISLDSDSVKRKEGESILRNIRDDDFVVAMDERGRDFTSVAFADYLKKSSEKNVVFVIGGALGLDKRIFERANLTMCLSKMTFTHSMARIFLLEQIYRSAKINAGENYHK